MINDEIMVSNEDSYIKVISENESTEGNSSLLNSIVEAVMRGDMNEVVSLALAHKNSSDSGVKKAVDEALSTAFSEKSKLKASESAKKDKNALYITDKNYEEPDVSLIVSEEVGIMKLSDDGISSQLENNKDIVTDSQKLTSDTNNEDSPLQYLQSTGGTQIPDSSAVSAQLSVNAESQNTSQQSMSVQLPGIGNFLVQIPPNWKPGEPITLPLNVPLTQVSQQKPINPLTVNMNNSSSHNHQIFSSHILSMYNPTNTNINTSGKKMRAIAPKPSKPTCRQPLIAPKNSSPSESLINSDSVTSISTSLPFPTGPGRRKGSKGKKAGRKKNSQRSQKDPSYASSTHSIDSQETIQYGEINTTKNSGNNHNSSQNTYQCNYFAHNDSEYVNRNNHSHYSEGASNALNDHSDNGEKDLLSLAWEISNAELSNNDDFSNAYHLYDANAISAESFVSSEILDQILQNIQKDDINEFSRGTPVSINIDSRINFSSSYNTLPPCSTVLPSTSATTSSNPEINTQCIEIAEVVNLNTEDMLNELEKDEHSLIDKFVAQYTHDSTGKEFNTTDTIVNSQANINIDNKAKDNGEDAEDGIVTSAHQESEELSEIAKNVEISCMDKNMLVSEKTPSVITSTSLNNDIDLKSSTTNSNSVNLCVIPNSLNLIYSNSDNSNHTENSQSRNLISVSVDGKFSQETSIFLANPALKSRTIDDFGLFELYSDEVPVRGKSDNELSQIYSQNVDENKYIQPPILEDVSDASPVYSEDSESDSDLEVDVNAFSLSKLTITPENVTQNPHSCIESNDCFQKLISNLPTLQDIESNKLNFTDIQWHFRNIPVESHDIFIQKPNDNQSTIIKEIKETFKSNDNLQPLHKEKMTEMNFRLSRLRKPPKKLAIYQSINIVEKEFNSDHNARRMIKTADCERYTRSKGKVTKSFDSFYDSLKRKNKGMDRYYQKESEQKIKDCAGEKIISRSQTHYRSIEKQFERHKKGRSANGFRCKYDQVNLNENNSPKYVFQSRDKKVKSNYFNDKSQLFSSKPVFHNCKLIKCNRKLEIIDSRFSVYEDRADFINTIDNPLVISSCKYIATKTPKIIHQELINYSHYNKATFPVRKMKRKFRIIGGLELKKSLKEAELLEIDEYNICETFDSPTVRRGCEYVIYLNSFDFCTLSEFDFKEASIQTLEPLSLNDCVIDVDDNDVLEPPLVIVEGIETKSANITDDTLKSKLEENSSKKVNKIKNVKVKKMRIPINNKKYSLRSRKNDRHNINIIGTHKILRKMTLRRRDCIIRDTRVNKTKRKSINEELLKINDIRFPICSIEKLQVSEINAFTNLSTNDSDKVKEEENQLKIEDSDDVKITDLFNVRRRIKSQFKKKRKWRIISKRLGCYLALQKKFKNNYKDAIIFNSKRNLENQKCIETENNLLMLERSMACMSFEPVNEKFPSEDESVEIDNTEDVPDSYIDLNNVETFQRSYGSVSLKIRVPKDPDLIVEETHIKKQKKFSKRHRRKTSKKHHEDVSDNEGSCTIRKRRSRKRKHGLNVKPSDQTVSSNENPPELTPESPVANTDVIQKPIKIKLFKSNVDKSGQNKQNDGFIFSLTKKDEAKPEKIQTVPKMLKIEQEPSSKPCRQAAHLAKKKIFSTAKEDRRSQNATLTSIWSSKKTNGNHKLTNDIINTLQGDRIKRPRGRPPKSRPLFFSEKYNATSGTLKLKIKLSKDYTCQDDNYSSTGETSGRTSTNESSILNSAVAGINNQSDALSLDSNNFINGLTDQLDQGIDYLEAGDARIYLDPNQVDIEKIKNSYYSSKKYSDSNSKVSIENQNFTNALLMNEDNSYHSNENSTSTFTDANNVRNSQSDDFSNTNAMNASNMYNNDTDNVNKSYSVSDKPVTVNKDDSNLSNNYSRNNREREPQDLSQSNQPFEYENQLQSPKNQNANCVSSWFYDQNMRDTLYLNQNNNPYESYMSSKQNKGQNTNFLSRDEEQNRNKRNSTDDIPKSVTNGSFTSPSLHYTRGGLGPLPSHLNIQPWSNDGTQGPSSLNPTAAAWMTYAQQHAAAAYMDPHMKAYYNLALSQSMLNHPYCGTYGNSNNSENFYSSLHSQYLTNSKDINDKGSNTSSTRNNSDPMNSFMEVAQMSSWEHFYSAAAMAGYHNVSQGNIEEYAGRAGNMLQAHQVLSGYQNSMFNRDHFSLDSNKPPLAHQNQSGSTSPIKPVGPNSNATSNAYSTHVQMPYNHFNGTSVENS